MAKTTQKTKAGLDSIKLTETIRQLAENQINHVIDALHGEVRVRPSRWHGTTSLYSIRKMLNLLQDMAYSDTISRKKIQNLKNTVGSFNSILGYNLSRSLQAAMNS
jgi:TFIIF-interacting CTD phosphatase-like protein